MPSSAPSAPNGTPNSTANGIDQLSYCAASTRKTITRPSPKTSPACPLAARSWNDCPEYADADALRLELLGDELVDLAASPRRVLRPGFGVPVKSAEPKPLNRSSWVGPLRNSVRTSADTGIISSSRPRT